MIAFARRQQPCRSRGWKRRFLELLPRIRNYAHFAFHSLNASEREEAIAEVVASAVCAFCRLVQLGKAELAYAGPLARYGVAQYRTGRRVASRMNAGDVLSPININRKRVRIRSLNPPVSDNSWGEGLVDNTQSPVPDQAAFRIDFPRWLEQLNNRDRRLAEFLAIGNSPSETATKTGLSRGRVSQLREELRTSWQQFHGELDNAIGNTHSITKEVAARSGARPCA